MKFIQSNEKAQAREIAQKAQARLVKEDLSPIPENYELWFVYYARSNRDIVKTFDQLIDEGIKITDAVCEDLYEQFLNNKKQRETVRMAGEQIQAALSDVSSIVHDVASVTKTYNEALENVSQGIRDAKSSEEVKTLVTTLTDKTQSMIDHNTKLEQELAKSAHVMEALKRDLEYARQEALTDGLTGLSNRKAFDEKIRQMIEAAETGGPAFTLLMVDIDHFKSFNDNFGHQVGDQVLRLVARTLKDGLKGYDFAARYGGEEFAILLPETELNGALAVGNSLRKAIAMKDVINRSTGDILGRITMSVGIAEYTEAENSEDMIERADSALYTAKHNGRNQVAAAPSPAQAKSSVTKEKSGHA